MGRDVAPPAARAAELIEAIERLPAKFQSVSRQPGGGVRISFVASPARLHLVQASTNPTDWEIIGVASDRGDGSFEFEDADTAKFSSRFYRVLSP